MCGARFVFRAPRSGHGNSGMDMHPELCAQHGHVHVHEQSALSSQLAACAAPLPVAAQARKLPRCSPRGNGEGVQEMGNRI